MAAVTGDASHIIQTALAPIFLLTGIGGLLNVFSQRLARVADHVEHISELMQASEEDAKAMAFYRHLVRLSRRRSALDTAVICAGVAGALTCAAAFTLFLVTLRADAGGLLLLWVFGLALGFTMIALAAFIVDTVLAWHGLRQEGPMPRSKPA